MQTLSVFFDLTKLADLRWKNAGINFWWNNADIRRTQEVCHMIYISFWLSLSKVKLRQVSSLQDMCDRFYGVWDLFAHPASVSSCEKIHPEQGQNFLISRIFLECMKITFEELQIIFWIFILILYIGSKNLKATGATHWRLWLWRTKFF